MLLLAILLLPTVLCSGRDVDFVKYVVRVNDKNTLTSINKVSNKALYDLNLSSLGIEEVDTSAFENFIDIKSVDLSNNWLSSFPEDAFSKLTSLQYLSLSDNNITSSKSFFKTWRPLLYLDLSNNPLEHLGESFLHGLKSEATVLTKGNDFSNISTLLFEAPKKPANEIIPAEKNEVAKQSRITDVKTNDFTTVEVCVDEKSTLYLVKIARANERIAAECTEVRVNQTDVKLSLPPIDIADFYKGWYSVRDTRISAVNFGPLRISEITGEVLNDLPRNVVEVDFTGSPINYLESEIIENWNLRSLIMDSADMVGIDGGALAKTKLTLLSLNDNYLTNTTFVASLPSSLTEIRLSGNKISKIPTDVFSKLENLVKLDLSGNNLRTLEPGFFLNLGSLRELNLHDNRISIYKGIFTGLKSIEYLNIGKNQLKSITKNILFAMPDSLSTVVLDFNGIEKLEARTFVRVPKNKLSLKGNNIVSIADGSFNLLTLKELDLGNNHLAAFEGNSFKGLPGLKRLSLADNKITKLKKGLWRHLKNLEILDLSLNPINQLEHGDLQGIVKSRKSAVLISGVPLERIRGNVFDN